MTMTSDTSPNLEKYSFNPSSVVCHERPPTNIFLDIESWSLSIQADGDDGDDCDDEEHLSRDWKHHYLFRLASPPLSIPFLLVSCGGPAPNIVNNSGFLAKGHCNGQMTLVMMTMAMIDLVMIQMISHPGSLEWPLSEEDPPPPPPSAVSIVFSISLKLQTSQSVPIRHAEAMCSRLWLGD